MSLYAVKVEKKKDDLYVATSDDFHESVSASTPASAIRTIKKSIERDIARILQQDEKLPDEAVIEDGTFILDIDVAGALEAASNEIVRRTVSLPKWMDIMIRNSRMDSSAVFKQAVMNKITADSDQISSVSELKEKVSADILKSYMMECILNMDNEGGNVL